MSRRSHAPKPSAIAFHRTKYGRELLVDAGFLRGLPNFDFSERPVVLGFHDILLVTRGRGCLVWEGQTERVAPGTLVFTAPGEVRSLLVPRLDGACLFFERDFVAHTFADPRFLDQFASLRPGRPRATLPLSTSMQRAFLSRFRRMQREIELLRDDASDALRAQLYDMLVTVNRWYLARHGAGDPLSAGPVERYLQLLDRDFESRHRVADYARELGISPGHLNALCHARLGRSAGACLRERRTLEAKRLLLHTDRTAAQIAEALGFVDPAYFARFFRREVGEPPSAWRFHAGPTSPGRRMLARGSTHTVE